MKSSWQSETGNLACRYTTCAVCEFVPLVPVTVSGNMPTADELETENVTL